jgi:hypothetical protein
VLNPTPEQAQNRNGTSTETRRRPFEGVDLSEAGRKGGRASGLSRRLKPLRQLEEGIAESRNGAAKMRLLEAKQREHNELLREQRWADETLMRLMDEQDKEREALERLKARRDELVAEAEQSLDALEQREQVLAAAVQADESALLGRLRAVHEAGQLEGLLVSLDLFEAVE